MPATLVLPQETPRLFLGHSKAKEVPRAKYMGTPGVFSIPITEEKPMTIEEALMEMSDTQREVFDERTAELTAEQKLILADVLVKRGISGFYHKLEERK